VIDVLLVDDHELVRGGIRMLLDSEPDLRVVGEAADAETALRRAAELSPRVAVVDLTLHGTTGLELVRALSASRLGVRVLVLSMHADLGLVAAALSAGARGYVVKGASAEALVHGIRSAASGARYLSPPLREDDVAAHETATAEKLTAREHEVFVLSAEGLTRTQIGERLGISPRTVEHHRERLMRKLRVRDRSALVRVAIERGLIPG
jgi:DNA-binding NarL/FixJ family response regulator